MKCCLSVLLRVFQPFLWTQRVVSLAGEAQGPGTQLVETAMLWVQLLTGGDMGQRSGFGLNHHKARGLAVPFPPAAVPFLSTQKGTGSRKKGGQNLGGSLLASSQRNSYLDRRKTISHLWYHTIPLFCSLSWHPTRCSPSEDLLAVRI